MTDERQHPFNDDSALSGESQDRIHPIVRLDYLVRLIGAPFIALIVITAGSSSGVNITPAIWVMIGAYAVVWPHVAFLIGRRSRDGRQTEMRILLLDSVAPGAAIALTGFQVVPSVGLLTGGAAMLASVGGLPLMLPGMAILIASVLITGATVTDFAVSQQASLFSTVVGASVLFGFQTMLALLTYRTARNFARSRRQIAEQAEEIRVQNDALLLAREEALLAANAKQAFLATMSHEIRTPLNGVIGMTRLLAETPLSDEQQDFVRTIQVSGATLLTVINDILEYSRIESGRLELESEPLRVRGVVEEALEIVADRARERGIELVCEIEPEVPEMILGDVTRLRQVLTNITGNAVKFTAAGEVVVNVSRRSGADALPRVELEFNVRDTGIGIPADRLPLLFTPFTQADASTTRRYGGTGLGLAICKRLTDLMGGTISVQSIAGKGSTFTFTVQGVYAEDPSGEMLLETVSLAGRRVLVVDDNATNRRVLFGQLSAWELEVFAAADAAEALRAVAEQPPFALGILDLHMPDVDGLTLAKQMREQPKAADLPLLLLSSSFVQSKDDPERLFRARMMKPVRQSKLLDSILQVLAGSAPRSTADSAGRGLENISVGAPLDILIADDNEINRKLAGIVFRRFGYDPDFAVDGREAVERVEQRLGSQRPYDLIFMDVHMPEMDGLEATRRIRLLESGTDVRHLVVAMTADAMPEDREVCLASGMNDYLTKPLEFEAVRRVLEHAASSSSATAFPLKERAQGPLQTADSDHARTEPLTVDWSRLAELREYDSPDGKMVNGAITLFVDQATSRLEILRSSVAAGDGPSVRTSAHALKGAALNIGANAVAEYASQLERAAKQNLLGGTSRTVEQLARAIGLTCHELRSLPPSARESKEMRGEG